MPKKFVPLSIVCLIRGLFQTNLCGLCASASDKNVLLSGRDWQWNTDRRGFTRIDTDLCCLETETISIAQINVRSGGVYQKKPFSSGYTGSAGFLTLKIGF